MGGRTFPRLILVAIAGGLLAPLSGHAASFFQAAGNNFQQTNPDGLVVIEAESFQTNTAQGGHSWTSVTTPAGFSGTAAMSVTPDNGGFQDTGTFVANSPRLDFKVNFIATGTHYVWVRGYGPDGNSDSVHVGLDGAAVATSDRISGFGAAYSWHKTTMDNVDATLDITTTGVHTINVWMREDGFIFDKILLTTNAAYVPAGAGPAESPQVAPPTGLAAVAGYDQVTLTWNAVAGAASYVILRSTAAGGPVGNPYVQIGTVNAPTVTFTDTTARFPNKYYYVVRAVANGVTSANSNEASASPLQPPVTALPNTGLQTNENGASTTFTIKYNAAQTAVSRLTVTSSDVTEGTVAANGLTTVAVAGGFYYDVPIGATPTIVVTVTGVDDALVDGNVNYQINITATNVAVPIPPVHCTNNDNDIQGLTFSRTAGLLTSESGGQATFDVTLNRQPFNNVSFTLTSSNTLEGTVVPGSLTFTNATGGTYNASTGVGGWNIAHTVTITGVDDTVLDFTVPYTIVTGTLTFADTLDQTAFTNGGVTAAPDVSCANLDNEVPPALDHVWGGGCGLLGAELLLPLLLALWRRRYLPSFSLAS